MDIQRLRDIFEKENSFAIVVGSSYTIDEMGGALALYLTLSAQGKDVSVISSKQPLVEVSNLVGIDRVKSAYESKGGDLIVSFPYQGDEIGKVSYTLEAGFLNIIVKPKENALSFGEQDVLFKRSGEVAPRVLIAVGVKRLSELSTIFSIDSLKDTVIVNIDKNSTNEGYGDVILIGQSASSVSEQIANVLLTLAYPMDPDISQNLLSGIVNATEDFQSPITSSLAFEMAGILLRNGAVRESLNKAPLRRPFPQPQPVNSFVDDVLPNPSLQQVVSQRQSQTSAGRQAAISQALRSASTQGFSTPTQSMNSNSAQALHGSSAQAEFPREQKKDEAPPDWLAPKIYKGSTNVE